MRTTLQCVHKRARGHQKPANPQQLLLKHISSLRRDKARLYMWMPWPAIAWARKNTYGMLNVRACMDRHSDKIPVNHIIMWSSLKLALNRTQNTHKNKKKKHIHIKKKTVIALTKNNASIQHVQLC